VLPEFFTSYLLIACLYLTFLLFSDTSVDTKPKLNNLYDFHHPTMW